MIRKILAKLKRYWWAALLVVVGGWGIYLAFTCARWPGGNCTGFVGKTVWEVLELLIIPATLAGIATYLDKLERKTDRENLKDNQREVLLQNYIEFITRLVLEKGLRESKEGDEVRKIAQTKTQTTYERLDPKRNEALVKFLSQLGLIQAEKETKPIISLESINLNSTDLFGIDLKGAFLENANLEEVIMDDAQLEGAKLSWAHLERANLRWAHLERSELGEAHLEGTDLGMACLEGASLYKANLEGANLVGAELEGVILYDANLAGTNLKRANLNGAKLEKTKLQSATMPDGKVYDPEIHTIEYLTGKRTEE